MSNFPRSRCGNDWDYFSHKYVCKRAQSLSSSLAPSVIKKEKDVPLDCGDPENQIFYFNDMDNELKDWHNKIIE